MKSEAKMKVAQSCPFLCHPMDYTVPGNLQARILEWVAFFLPAMQETPVQSLGQEDPLEKGKATHSRFLGLPWWLSW